MTAKPLLFPIAVLLSLSYGCASAPRVARKAPADADYAIQPAIQVQPAPKSAAPQFAVVDEAPIPVWKPTRIVKVRVAPYLNERGEAFPESFKYVVAEEGSWNMDALQNPERAYIPAENTQKVLSAPGAIYGVISPGSAPQDTALAASVPTRSLYDMSQIRLTGLFDRRDESKARVEAENIKSEIGPYTVGFDADLGWIILPQTAILPALDSSSAGGVPVRAPQTRGKPATADKDIR